MAEGAGVDVTEGLFWFGCEEQEQRPKQVMLAKNAAVTKERLFDIIGKQDVISA
jgi:hypothetical protein